ncbi:MAG: hypothetical protein NT166_02785 [Candidatus Aminicenantes bacterium]|nr:hypothetical protein [Candidatus Aminicenantes bacterium]
MKNIATKAQRHKGTPRSLLIIKPWRLGALVAIFLTSVGMGVQFPPDGFAGGWQKKEPVREFDRNGLYGHIDGGSELFLEFGFENLQVQTYRSNSDDIAVEVYRMDIPQSALGIYLLKCGKETPVPGIPVRNTGDYNQIMLLHGNYFLIVNNLAGKSSLLPVMVQLAGETLKLLPGDKEKNPGFSQLFSPLPLENRVAGSELLVRGYYSLQSIYTLGEGDILLLENKIFGVTAQYKNKNGGDYNLLVVRYPDEAYARKAFANLRANLDSYIKVLGSSENSFTFKDYRDKYGRASMEKQVLSIQFNLTGI